MNEIIGICDKINKIFEKEKREKEEMNNKRGLFASGLKLISKIFTYEENVQAIAIYQLINSKNLQILSIISISSNLPF